MKNYSTKSWHYRLATVYGPMSSYHVYTNRCDYMSHVFWGAMVAFLVVPIAGVVAGSVLGAPILWLGFNLAYGWIFPSDDNVVVVLGLCVYAAATMVALVYGLHRVYEAIRMSSSSSPSRPSLIQRTTDAIADSFVGHVYDSVKNKFCYEIIFTETVDPLNCVNHIVYTKIHDQIYMSTQRVLDHIDSYIMYKADWIYDDTAKKWIKPADGETIPSQEEIAEFKLNAEEITLQGLYYKA